MARIAQFVAGVVVAWGLGLGAVAQENAAAQLQRLEVLEKSGKPTSDLANQYHNLAIQLRNASRDADAERPATRALAIWEKIHGRDSDQAGNAHNTLAAILDQLRKDAEAEHHARRALEIWEARHGIDSGAAANALNTLVGIMRTRGRWADAEEPARRVLATWRREYGPESDAVANASNTLANVLDRNSKFAEAETLARTALKIWQKLHGADSGAAINARNTLASALDGLGRKDEAIREQELVLDSWTKTQGPRSGTVGLGANNLAWKQLGAGHAKKAQKLFELTLDIWSKEDIRPGKPSTVIPLSGLARTAWLQNDWQQAFARVKQAVAIAIERTKIGSAETDKIRASRAPSEITQASGNLDLLIKAAYRFGNADPAQGDSLALETFKYAQWRMGSEAADALAALASRVTTAAALSPLVRERQDLENLWHANDKALEVALRKSAPSRDRVAELSIVAANKQIEVKLASLEKRLSKDFPNYAAIARPDPLDIAETQAKLRADESLVLFLDTPEANPAPEETFIWIVTKTGMRWLRSDLGTPALTREVAALRCGLDGSNWIDASRWSEADDAAITRKRDQIARRDRCKELTGREASHRDLPPFDLARAHTLYKALLGEAEDLLKNPDGTWKSLIVVPSGPLTQLPFQVIVTEKPAEGIPASTDAYRAAKWLGVRQPITVLPSVASLKALRGLPGKVVTADRRPYLGIGNPLLDGPDARFAQLKEDARAKQTCPKTPEPAAGPETAIAAATAGAEDHVTRGAVGDVAAVRRWRPLPETADELCAVAAAVGASAGDVWLGARATEAALKALSAKGELERFAVLHFATHGLVTGNVPGLDEPALMLTPPESPSEEDDGLLKASEVAGLRLNADWVILSACNTSAGGAKDAEALSGLARTFFYAGAKTLVVSHWEVYTKAAVALVTKAITNLKSDPTIGRAEAFRRAMIVVIASGSANNAHPAVWAPFVVVGEGGAGRG